MAALVKTCKRAPDCRERERESYFKEGTEVALSIHTAVLPDELQELAALPRSNHYARLSQAKRLKKVQTHESPAS